MTEWRHRKRKMEEERKAAAKAKGLPTTPKQCMACSCKLCKKPQTKETGHLQYFGQTYCPNEPGQIPREEWPAQKSAERRAKKAALQQWWIPPRKRYRIKSVKVFLYSIFHANFFLFSIKHGEDIVIYMYFEHFYGSWLAHAWNLAHKFFFMPTDGIPLPPHPFAPFMEKFMAQFLR